MRHSLRWQLSLAVALGVGAVLLLAGFWLASQLRGAMEEAAMTRLRATAEHVSAFLPFESPDNWSQGEYDQPYSGHYWELLAWQVDQAPVSLARSDSLTDVSFAASPIQHVTPLSESSLLRLTGPLEQSLIALPVMLPVGPEPGRFVMLIAAPAEPLETQTSAILAALWRGGLVIWLLCVLAAALAIAAAARPIHLLRQQLADLDQGGRQRLDVAVPSEFQGLVQGFNTVLDQHARTVARHRDAVAQLAHELKTPLAALQQSAEAGPSVSSEAVLSRVRRMLPPIEQEVARARIHGPSPGLQPQRLKDQVMRAVQVCRVDHDVPAAQIELEIPETFRVAIEARDLYTVVWNLMDNALRHGGAPIRVEAYALGFAIHDSGGASQLQRESTGIGLGLVDAVLETYGWRCDVQASPLGGRCVRVLPA